MSKTPPKKEEPKKKARKKREPRFIPHRPIELLLKSGGAKRVSKSATTLLRLRFENITKTIGSKAQEYASFRRAKTVTAQDIELALDFYHISI